MAFKTHSRRDALLLLAGSLGLGLAAAPAAFAETDRVARKYRKLRARILPRLADHSFGAVASCDRDGAAAHPIAVRVPPGAFSIVSDYRSSCGIHREDRGDYGRHRGIDMMAPRGTPVLACADGRVEVSQRARTPGEEIWIEHGGLRTRYIHLGDRLVRAGEPVRRGQVIATVSATGAGAGRIDHLHLETFRSDEPDGYTRVNPHALWHDGPGQVTLHDPDMPQRFVAKPLGLTFPLPAKSDVDRRLRDLARLLVAHYQ